MRTWRWAQMGRATRHRERLQTRCNLQPASVWGTASTGGSPWRWDTRTCTRYTWAACTAGLLSTPSPPLRLCSSPPLPLLSPSASWEIWLGSEVGGEDCSFPNGLHDTDSSPAPRGPQQQRLVKRCSVIISAVTTLIFLSQENAGIRVSFVPLARTYVGI